MTMFVTRKNCAELLGVSRQRIEQLIKAGVIPEGPQGIDPVAAKAAYAARTDPAKRHAARQVRGRNGAAVGMKVDPGPAEFDGEIVPFDKARTRRENWAAKRAELDYKQLAGELVSREEIRAKEFAVARKLRDRILGFPARLANWVTPEAMKIISDECDQLIRELQEDAARIAEEMGV